MNATANRIDRGAILAGLKVVNRATGLPGGVITSFLASLGAEVSTVPPPGDPSEQRYPAWPAWHDMASVTRGLDNDAPALAEMLSAADVIVLGGEDFPELPATLDAAELSARNPSCVVLHIEGYPEGFAAASRPAVDILVQARSGMAFEHYSDRPLRIAFEPSLYGAVLQGLSGVFAALIDRARGGSGQVVRASLLEGTIQWAAGLWTLAEKPTPYSDFVPPLDPFPMIYPCADGEYIHFVMGAPGSKYAVYQILGIDDPDVTPESSALPKMGDPPRNFFGEYDRLAPYVLKFKCDDLVAAISAKGYPAVRVPPPGELWSEPQIEMNGIVAADSAGRKSIRHPVMFDDVPASWSTPSAGEMPLSGIRVIDLGAYVAGPAATAQLAELGAEVIKVESLAGDPARVMFRSFSFSNRAKRVVSLDLKLARETVLELCKSADVVTNNFRGGVSERLGLDHATLHALKPDLVVMESSAWGPTGPKAGVGGFDPVAQAASGLEWRAGGIGNAPLWSRTFMCDYCCAQIGAMATLVALYHRTVTGHGSTISAPLMHAGLFLLSELVKMPDGAFVGAEPLNAAQTGYLPSEAFYKAQDGWLAIAARGDRMAASLADALKLTDMPSSVADWGDHEEQRLRDAIAALLLEPLLERLEQAGIWAERCVTDGEAAILGDAGLQKLGTVRRSQHPQFGELLEVGVGMRFSRSRRGTDRPARDNGADTDTILRELGYDEARIAAMREAKLAK